MLLEIEKYHNVSDNNVNNYVDVLEQFLYNKDILVSLFGEKSIYHERILFKYFQ